MSKSDFTAKAKSEMAHRSQGWCEARTPACKGTPKVFHHRLMRSHGGKGRADNGLHVCRECHHYIHHNPSISYEQGWLIRSGRVVVDNQREWVER